MKTDVKIASWRRVIADFEVKSYLAEKHEAIGSQIINMYTACHSFSSGHRKRDALLHAVHEDDVYLPNAYELVLNFGQQCPDCAMTDLKVKKHVVQHPIVPSHVLERVQYDLISLSVDVQDFKFGGNSIDCFSKFLVGERTFSSF